MNYVRLQQVADWLLDRKGPSWFAVMLRRLGATFDFAQERQNRMRRFVKVIKAYDGTARVDDIASEFNCSKGTVLRYARMAGKEKRSRKIKPGGTRERVLARYAAGETIANIAAAESVSQAYVSQEARKAGISRYQRRKKR